MSTIDDEEEEDKKASMQFPTSMQNGLFIFPPNNNNNRREEQKLPGFPRSVEEKIIDEKGQEVMVARMERSDRPRFEYKGSGEYIVTPDHILFGGNAYSTADIPFMPWVPGSGNPRDIRSWDFFVSGKPYPMHPIMEVKIQDEKTWLITEIQFIHNSEWTSAEKIAAYNALARRIAEKTETTRMPFLKPLYFKAIKKINKLKGQLVQQQLFNKIDSASKRDPDDAMNSSKKTV